MGCIPWKQRKGRATLAGGVSVDSFIIDERGWQGASDETEVHIKERAQCRRLWPRLSITSTSVQ